MAVSGSEFLRHFRILQEQVSSIGDCGICHRPITDIHPDEVKLIGGKPVHEDCYYEEFGKGIEEYPIAVPH